MKKLIIFTMLFILTLSLTACGKEVSEEMPPSYTDPNTYYTLIKDKVNELDLEYFDELNLYIQTLEIQDSIEEVKSLFTSTFTTLLGQYEDMSEQFYTQFAQKVEDGTSFITSGYWKTSEDLAGDLKEFAAFSQEQQQIYIDAAKDTVAVWIEYLTDISEQAKEMTREQLDEFFNSTYEPLKEYANEQGYGDKIAEIEKTMNEALDSL